MRAAHLLRHASLMTAGWPRRIHALDLSLSARRCVVNAVALPYSPSRPPPPCVDSGRQPPAPFRLGHRRHNHASVAATAATPGTPSLSSLDHTPLLERPPAVAVTPAELAAWAAWARGVVAALGPGGLAGDGGPSSAELQSELRWFLEDAVAGPAGPGGGSPPPPPPGASPAWSSLEAQLRDDDAPSALPLIWLRSALPDLTARWAARLTARVPFQYTVGAAHWRDLVLAVGPGVLCPRPETEQLVDLAVEAVKSSGGGSGGAWADVCTGSGAVAAGLVSAFRGAGLGAPDAVWATDISPLAAGWARANVARLGLQATVHVVEGDLLAALPPGTPPLRGLLSNPPYIPTAQMPGLQPEVGLHEPALALDGGDAAGLVILRRLCANAATFLAPGGFLGLETAGHGQAEQVADLLGGAFESVAVHQDMCGVVRFVTGRRRTDV